MRKSRLALMGITLGLTATGCTTNKQETPAFMRERYVIPARQGPAPKPGGVLIEVADSAKPRPTPPVQRTTPTATPKPLEELKTATPVPGEPGVVFSPYKGNAKVDVKGFPPGTQALDPYTNQPFLVPLPEEKPAEKKNDQNPPKTEQPAATTNS